MNTVLSELETGTIVNYLEDMDNSQVMAGDKEVRYYIDWSTGESTAHFGKGAKPSCLWISSQSF